HNITLGYKIAQNGDKLGLASAFSIKNGLFADIRRIDNNLRTGIVQAFKNLPTNIAASTNAIKTWTMTTIRGIPTAFVGGLNALKMAFLGIPNFIRTAIVSFRAFSLTLLTSPLGWIALAIGAVALVIYKYWKPISGFFKGLWSGLMEGLQPLMPVFKKVATAIEPLIKPIRAIIDWIKKIVKPVEDTGGAAEKMGVRFGKAIGNIIVKIANFVATIFSFGIKIPTMLANGILAGVGKVRDAIKTITQTIRDHLPHSPAKVGPLKDLNKIKLVETIASTIKPTPIMAAMSKTLGVVSSGIKANVGRVGVGGGSTVINYNPTITLSGGNASLKDEFTQLLKKHKEEILKLVRQENERKLRLAY
ncbi:MAG: hypothetical protein MJ060_05200, partial [Clostridia bacterium]|nr:hypothetical protein [Clostridia bacterium]